MMTQDERRIIIAALAEDAGAGDPTTAATIGPFTTGKAYFLAKADGILAGIQIVCETFAIYAASSDRSASVSMTILVQDGTAVTKGMKLAELSAPLDVLLTAERVALNLLQRMCGIATSTHHFVEAVKGTKATIIDTRKTAPLLRPFDRYGVRMGGGQNHRYSLGDMMLVKDNHIAANGGNIELVIEKIKTYFESNPRIPVELEVTSLEQFERVMANGKGVIDRVLFDNFELETLREAVKRNDGVFKTEASGGVNLTNVTAIAETGVDYISIGALTHSVVGLDISLEVE
ncbi:MAG TPA: carboxylating nicotinate-nucleotide diphosphorylase [Candidatus Kapabacteria bacterium]|nr:carboxylating nicotinate-nucleotide diphosphorylase [Candidatus Kapabacteria bacterium]